jgi:hypothetical protein
MYRCIYIYVYPIYIYIHTYPIYSRLHLHLVVLVDFPHWSWWTSLRVPELRTASSSQGARCPGKASDRSSTVNPAVTSRNQWAGDEPCQTKLEWKFDEVWWNQPLKSPQYIELGDEPPKLKVLACFFSHVASISLMLRFSCLLPSAAGFPSLWWAKTRRSPLPHTRKRLYMGMGQYL